MFSVLDVMFRWHSLLPVEVGVGISFASEIMVIPSQYYYLELECPHCQK
jgi:ubiquitin C-terminal hydrolase